MKKIIPILMILSVLIISGCASQTSTAPTTCGNKIVDVGEECDASSCTGGKVCTENCRCEGLAPPALPED